ncbi:phosphatidylinositol-3,5-bisphosphate 5-phosphatase [Microsporum audouinii]
MESFDDVALSLNAVAEMGSFGEQSAACQPQPHEPTDIKKTSFDSVVRREGGGGLTNAIEDNNSANLPLTDSPATALNLPEPQRRQIEDTRTRTPQQAFDSKASNHPFEERRGSASMLIFDDDGEGGDEEPYIAKSFERTTSPTSAAHRSRDDTEIRSDGNSARDAEKDGELPFAKMHKFSLYETATRYYLVGMDLLDRRFRMLKIDRTSDPDEDLVIAEDETIYSKKEMNQLLDAVDDGNKISGGLKLRCSTWGLLGFIRFTGSYYMLLITKRSQVAMLGGHYIYQIDGTELIPLDSPATTKQRPEKHADEARFIAVMNNIDLTRSFYFSYSYNISRTLQDNIVSERQAIRNGQRSYENQNHNSMFVWNQYFLNPAIKLLKNIYDWFLPITHGYVDQSAISIYGRLVYLTLIARRSRFFAGARYLKRGVNDLGYVANDVETEQIVSDMLTTSFHAPGPELFANPQYTSYVQHRGSIPLAWTQDSTGVTPKPDISLSLVDPFYSAAALHFNNLFERYGTPVYVLNLIKAREKIPRESKLLTEYTNAVNYLNQFLPDGKKIIYRAWDMSRASKSRDQDVIGTLESIADDIIPKTGFFRNGEDEESGLRMQNGIARTNCIDCLDRTNAAQFVIAKRALGYQLQALGIIDHTYIEYDTDAINIFTNMWHGHGDTIAVQYGGSHLVNTMATYRKLNQWTGHSRDMVESFKRYYNNSFLDAQRQEAYNLFLGNYVFSENIPMLWNLTTDYYLHHSDPRARLATHKQNYIHWFNEEHLQKREMPPAPSASSTLASKRIREFDDYWLEYYRPRAISSFSKMFSFKMRTKLPDYRLQSMHPGEHDLSPFVVRTDHEPEHQRDRKNPPNKRLTIQEPSDESKDHKSGPNNVYSGAMPLQHWLQPSSGRLAPQSGILKGAQKPPTTDSLQPNDPVSLTNAYSHPPYNATKAQISQWSFGQLIADSLNPSISSAEAEEYERYVNHPLKVPLVVTSEASPTATSLAERSSNLDLFEYANRSNLENASLNTIAESSMADYTDFLTVGDEGLTVNKDDYDKKRYKRYRQWLRGKSLFKQGVEV